MSEQAREARTRRARWALPSSGHDRLVLFLRVVLPAAVGIVAAGLVFLPLTTGGDVSFVLDKNKVEVAKERMRLQSARYTGQDDKGRPFVLTAGSALQKSSKSPVVDISRMSADIQLDDGPGSLQAETGRYDTKQQQMTVDSPVTFRGPRNYSLNARRATVDLRTRQMTSDGGVTGSLPQGTFSGDRLSADLDRRDVRLDGRAHLRIMPGQAK